MELIKTLIKLLVYTWMRDVAQANLTLQAHFHNRLIQGRHTLIKESNISLLD